MIDERLAEAQRAFNAKETRLSMSGRWCWSIQYRMFLRKRQRSDMGGHCVKRFTETDKWRDPWFQGLPVTSKVLFLYLTDNCNNAGFIEENPRQACFEIGISDVEYEGALKGLGRGIKGASGWLWVRRFLRHQKNEPLNSSNPAHKQILRLVLEQTGRFDGLAEFDEFQRGLKAPLKGLQRPIGTGTGKGTGTSLEEVQGKPFLERVRTLFHKRSSTPLDKSEVKAWEVARVSVEQTSEDEWRLLEWVYRQSGNDIAKYRRHDMATLLNNWNGAIDKAREWKNGQGGEKDDESTAARERLREFYAKKGKVFP